MSNEAKKHLVGVELVCFADVELVPPLPDVNLDGHIAEIVKFFVVWNAKFEKGHAEARKHGCNGVNEWCQSDDFAKIHRELLTQITRWLLNKNFKTDIPVGREFLYWRSEGMLKELVDGKFCVSRNDMEAANRRRQKLLKIMKNRNSTVWIKPGWGQTKKVVNMFGNYYFWLTEAQDVRARFAPESDGIQFHKEIEKDSMKAAGLANPETFCIPTML